MQNPHRCFLLWIKTLFRKEVTLRSVATVAHLLGQYTVKAPFHPQVRSNESEKTKVVVPSVLNCAIQGEISGRMRGGKSCFSTNVRDYILTTDWAFLPVERKLSYAKFSVLCNGWNWGSIMNPSITQYQENKTCSNPDWRFRYCVFTPPNEWQVHEVRLWLLRISFPKNKLVCFSNLQGIFDFLLINTWRPLFTINLDDLFWSQPKRKSSLRSHTIYMCI